MAGTASQGTLDRTGVLKNNSTRTLTPGRIKVSSGSVGAKDPEFFDGIIRTMSSHSTTTNSGALTLSCQLAVALTQAAVVVGSVYLKGSLGLIAESKGEVFHPIVFAFAREASAAPLLFAISVYNVGYTVPARMDVLKVALLGFCMFLSQLLYIIGIELSGVVVASCIQPAIPVFTVLLGIVLKMESAHPQKLVGILLAVLGAVCMVLGSVPSASNNAENLQDARQNVYLGNFCLLTNTIAMACYYILAKKLVARYSPMQVAAWAYMVAASLMGIAALIFTSHTDWMFPRVLVLPLLYWVFVCSVGGYLIVTWAMKHLPASQVAAFQCLQPFLGSLLAFLVLREQLSWWDLGAIGVVAGLMLVSVDAKYETMMASLHRRVHDLHGSFRRVASFATINKK